MDKYEVDWEKYRRTQNGGLNLMLRIHSPQYSREQKSFRNKSHYLGQNKENSRIESGTGDYSTSVYYVHLR